MVIIPRRKNTLTPGPRAHETLQTAISDATARRLAEAEAAEKQKMVDMIAAQVHRAGSIARLHAVQKTVDRNAKIFSTAWTRIPIQSDTTAHTEVKLETHVLASTIRFGIPMKYELNCVHLYTRLRDTLSDEVSEAEFPVIFIQDAQDPKIILSENPKLEDSPSENNGGLLVLPDSEQWADIDRCLREFEKKITL